MLMFLSCLVAWGQGGTATVTGTVYDPTGAVVPNVTVSIINTATGVARTLTTDARGFFAFVAVPPGGYNLEAKADGFKPFHQEGIRVQVNDQIELKNVALVVAHARASVEVVSQPPGIITPTTSGDQSYTLSRTQLEAVPLMGRSVIELLGLIPGSQNTGGFNGKYSGEVAGFTQNAPTYTVNGTRFDQVVIKVDGSQVNELDTSGASGVTPNANMTQEVNVQTAAYSAAEANGPIVVSTQTRSGGKSFHGEVYDIVRNHALNADDWQNERYGLPKPQSSFNYSGLNLGGPVLIPGTTFNKDPNKLFFFAGFEYMKQAVDGGVRETITPTQAMRNGDFTDSAYITKLNGWAVNTPVGQIAPAKIDPGGQILMNLFPLPNANPSTAGGFNYVSDFVTSQPRNQELLRMDYYISDKMSISGRYNHEGENVPWPYGPWNMWNMTPYPASQVTNNRSNSLNLSATYVPSPSLTNQLTVGITRFTLETELTNAALVSRSALNYPYANLYPTGSAIVPNVCIQTAACLYLAGGEYPNYTNTDGTYTIDDGVSKVLGTHLLRAGVYFAYLRYPLRTQGFDNGLIQTQNWISTTTGNEFADLLEGNIGNYQQSSSNIMAHMAENQFDFYGMDKWRIGRRLTVNYGLRVDHIGWWYDQEGRVAIFDPSMYDPNAAPNAATGMVTHATDPSVPLSGAKPVSFQFAPSGGFAWDLNGKGSTVVRGGFGTNYFIDPGTNMFTSISAPPNVSFTNIYNTMTLAGVSSLSTSSLYPAPWGTADPSDHHVPVTYSWNLAIARALPWSMHLEAGYVGNTSRHLAGFGTLNNVPEGCELGIQWASTWSDQPCRPYHNYSEIAYQTHSLNANYNALQVTASRQKGRINFWFTYTYGKTMAYNCLNPFDEERCYAPATFDRTQIVNFSFYLTAPDISKNHLGNHKVVNGVLDGWHLSGISQFSSGAPIDAPGQTSYANSLNVLSLYSDYTSGTFSMDGRYIVGTPDEQVVPQVVCNPTANLAPHQYLNPACLLSPSPGHNGSYTIPYIHGPISLSNDLGMSKTFRLGSEARSLQFRAEAFNFLNQPLDEFLVNDPNLSLGFSGYGQPTTTTSAGIATNKTGHRIVQLALKFSF
jgi:hypothetical protein